MTIAPRTVLACSLCLTLLGAPLTEASTADASVPTPSAQGSFDTATGATDDTRAVGVIISVAGIVIGLVVASASLAAENVECGPVNLSLATNHFHVGDNRVVTVSFPFNTGNLLHSGGLTWTTLEIDGEKVTTSSTHYGSVQGTQRTEFPVQGQQVATTNLRAIGTTYGQDAGIIYDDWVYRTAETTMSVGVLSPLSPPTINPMAGQSFQHPGPIVHSMFLDNFSSTPIRLKDSRVGTSLVPAAVLPAGQDFGAAQTTQVTSGAVAHTGTHDQMIEPVAFSYGYGRASMYLATTVWNDNGNIEVAQDFCILEGRSHGDGGEAAPPPRPSTAGRTISSGCFDAGLVQVSDVAHDFGLEGITVSISNDIAVAPVHDLTTDANGQFCWSNLDLSDEVDLILNSDGNVAEVEYRFLQNVPRDLLESGDPLLEINFAEAAAPRITGTLAASDGLPIDARVYSRRAGYPDLLLGVISSGAFDLGGFGMLEFDGMDSEIVFEPVVPFNRTLTPADPIVVPVDMTQTDEAPVGDITFTVAPRTNASPITFRGQFIDDALNPVAGLEVEVRDGGGALITPIISGPDGRFEVSVPNGQATVEAINLIVLGFVDLPAQSVDFGQNGSTVLDVGQRRLVPLDPTVPRARLVPQPVRICEGAGSVPLTLELDRSASAPVSVDYQTVANSATAGTDFTSIAGTATFPSGTTQLPLTVTILDDSDVEGDEQLSVELVNPSGVLLSSAPTTIVIDDDDDGTPLGDATRDCVVDAGDLAAMVELIDTGAATPAQADCDLSGGPVSGADQVCTAQRVFAAAP